MTFLIPFQNGPMAPSALAGGAQLPVGAGPGVPTDAFAAVFRDGTAVAFPAAPWPPGAAVPPGGAPADGQTGRPMTQARSLVSDNPVRGHQAFPAAAPRPSVRQDPLLPRPEQAGKDALVARAAAESDRASPEPDGVPHDRAQPLAAFPRSVDAAPAPAWPDAGAPPVTSARPFGADRGWPEPAPSDPSTDELASDSGQSGNAAPAAAAVTGEARQAPDHIIPAFPAGAGALDQQTDATQGLAWRASDPIPTVGDGPLPRPALLRAAPPPVQALNSPEQWPSGAEATHHSDVVTGPGPRRHPTATADMSRTGVMAEVNQPVEGAARAPAPSRTPNASVPEVLAVPSGLAPARLVAEPGSTQGRPNPPVPGPLSGETVRIVPAVDPGTLHGHTAPRPSAPKVRAVAPVLPRPDIPPAQGVPVLSAASAPAQPDGETAVGGWQPKASLAPAGTDAGPGTAATSGEAPPAIDAVARSGPAQPPPAAPGTPHPSPARDAAVAAAPQPATENPPVMNAAGAAGPPRPLGADTVTTWAAVDATEGARSPLPEAPFLPSTPDGTAPRGAQAIPGTPPPEADTAKILRQVAQAFSAPAAQPGHAVEVTLSPEELGRVRMTLAEADGAITVAIQAERGDTAELLRRHADLLGQELRELGYRQVQFDFGAGTDRRAQFTGVDTPPEILVDEDAPPDGPSAPASGSALPGAGTLDIRL